ncbi:hypothetical protein AAC387_Pa06g0400 [Persea americana]
MDANNNDNMNSSVDWRTQLQPNFRPRIIEKLLETLKRLFPASPEDLAGVASKFEEKIYSVAANRCDYLRKISVKMMALDSKSLNGADNSIPSNYVGNQNPSDPAIQGLHSQLCNPGQSLPMGNQSQPRQQLLPQNLQNAIASNSVQSPSSLQTALSSMTGLTQTAMSNVVSQNSNLQAMSGISQNCINNSVGQGVPSNMFSNAQRHMQGRQHSQQVLSQQQQQQSQNPQQFYQHHTMNQKLQQGIMQPPLLQSHMHQHPSLLQPNQMQPSQQSLMQMSSTLQSSQAAFKQIQPSMVQSAPQSSLIQNQHSSVQQPRPSGLQQHQQSVLRQQQPHQPSLHQQTSVLHQQQTPINQQPIVPSQQQQQLVAQESSATNMQQNQLLAQQNSVLDMKHQQHQQKMMLSQQNNLSNVQQQQLFSQQNKNLHQQQQLSQQSNFSGQQQQQQQHLIGSHAGLGTSSMQQHQHPENIMQQTKGAAQQQPQQTSSTLLPSQGQQSQSQPVQQLSSQPQPVQLQQQQQQHTLQQRIQTSASLDSAAQTGQPGATDLQEEIYQKIKSMKELYLPELTELHQKISMRCQQLEAHPQHPKQTDAIEKLKSFKISLDRMTSFLQFPKSSILPTYKEKLPQLEKQIINYLTKNSCTKPAASLQPGHQQLQQSVGQPHLLMQQPQSQIHQLQQQENQVNPMQPMSMQDSMTSMQSTAVSSLQRGSMPLSNYMGVPATQQNMINSLQTSSNLESTLGHTLRSLPQGALGSLQQNTINAPQKTNTGTLSHSTVNQLQPSVNSLPLNSSILQQHLKQQQQEHQLMQSQQLKQQYQQHPQHHLLQFIQQQHKQQVFQRQQQPQMQQQFQQQQLYQQQKQLQAQQIPQLHQMNEVNELKVRPGAGIKSELLPQPHHAGQRQTTYQLKTGSPFSVSSPQLLQAASPQLSQHSSPQIDLQNLHTAPSKVGTPLQSANSPLIGASPSTPSAPSPIPGDSEKQSCFISSTPNAGNTGHQQAAHGPTQAQSLSIGTPGISASPLLAEFTSYDGNQGNVPSNLSGKSSTLEQPLERLIKVVRSISLKAFSSSVIDIGSVVSMIDTIAGSAPGNGSRAAAGEDLVAMTKCHLQARNFISHDGSCTTKKKRLRASVMPLHAVSSACSANDSFKSDLENSELESTATTRIRRHRAEVNNALLQEVREINQRLIDTNIEISDEDVDSIAAAAEGEGTIVKCSFNALAATSNLKSQYASAQIFPILPLRLFVPANYPNCSPILLDKLPKEPSKEFEDLSVKARLRFSISLRGLLQPMSLGEMTQTWDDCARMVIAEYAQQSGGGSFSSRYGTWENCVRA